MWKFNYDLKMNPVAVGVIKGFETVSGQNM